MVGATTRFVRRDLTAALFTAPGSEAVRYLGSVRVAVRYDAADPFAVVLSFATTPMVRWTVSRELLTEGLRTAAGVGDVQIVPSEQRVRVVLSSPTGRCALFFHRADLVDALAATAAVVPLGDESARIDWGREFARLGEAA